MTKPVFRFAPSPTGDLHLGSAYSALVNFRLAELTGGRMILRVEDVDTTRSRPDFERGILDDLAWLGLRWEEPVRRQSEHFDEYGRAMETLKRDGLVYPSFLSRKEISGLLAQKPDDWPRDPDGTPHYPGAERTMPPEERAARLAAGDRAAWRLDMAAALERIGGSGDLSWWELPLVGTAGPARIAARPGAWGDAVLVSKDYPASYHLAVVHDDALQGVTHVVRGQDLYHATGLHRLLQTLLGLPEPVYLHHPLLLDAKGRKLSKSDRDTSVSSLRKSGGSRDEILAMLPPLPESAPSALRRFE